jgi:hypothetical protein
MKLIFCLLAALMVTCEEKPKLAAHHRSAARSSKKKAPDFSAVAPALRESAARE